MEHVNLGATGLRVSRLCLGMMSYAEASDRPWVLDQAAAEPIVHAAWDAGVRFFDTADAYSEGRSEVLTGRLLRALGDREEMVVATKVFMAMTPGENGRGLSRKHVLAAIDASLQRLGMDYVDLYQVHRWDPCTPIEETMEVLHDVVRAGKARYLGASSLYAWQLAKAQHTAQRHGWTPFASVQSHYNLVYREEEREMLPLCADQGIAVLPWSPLARGLLARAGQPTERARSDTWAGELYDQPGDADVVQRVGEIAADRGVKPAQVALAWLLGRSTVTAPIVGATRAGHIEDAVAALDLELCDDERGRLEEPYVPHPVRGIEPQGTR
jgi:aryl-alcohol dehydrogenase-like predicted oxidoreductase